MPYIKKKFNLKTAGNVAFSQTGSEFVYACAVDLRTSARKGEENFRCKQQFCVVIFAREWVFWSANNVMTSVTGSNISLP